MGFNEILSDFFGPGVGLVGFAVMLVLFLPKLLRYLKSRRAKRDAKASQKPKPMGMRSIQATPSDRAANIIDHPDHGEAVENYCNDKISIILQAVSWILPLVIVLLFVPSNYRSIFAILLAATVPMALIGILSFKHLGDHITFYRTGMTGKLNGKHISIDYNAICETTERPALLPWMAPTYLIHLDDNQILSIDESSYKCKRKQTRKLIASLSPRVISSVAEENMRLG